MNTKPNKDDNLFNKPVAELIATGFQARIIRVVKKKDEDESNRRQVMAAFLGREIRPAAEKEFADVEFSRTNRRGRMIKTTRNMPLGMVPRGLVAAYQARTHGDSCQRAKPGVKTRFV